MAHDLPVAERNVLVRIDRIMDRKYDLFKRLPDGSLVWRAAIVGRNKALAGPLLFSTDAQRFLRPLHYVLLVYL
jgi:hypothetical protein